MLKKSFILPFFYFVVVLLFLSSCATKELSNNENDPFESINRDIYAFNLFFDDSLARPIAKSYEKYMPSPIQTGVHNFYENIDDITVTLNDLLQAKLTQGGQDASRLVINSTIGMFGLIDFASDFGFKKHNEDLNQTLGYWGVPSGPYLMIPILGPYNVRSFSTGLVENTHLNPLDQIQLSFTRNSLITLDFFDTRVNLLLASEMLDIAALDPYSYLRESYIQRQKSLIYDGNIPEEEFDELDMLDDF